VHNLARIFLRNKLQARIINDSFKHPARVLQTMQSGSDSHSQFCEVCAVMKKITYSVLRRLLWQSWVTGISCCHPCDHDSIAADICMIKFCLSRSLLRRHRRKLFFRRQSDSSLIVGRIIDPRP
jgi:hypothetical protein